MHVSWDSQHVKVIFGCQGFDISWYTSETQQTAVTTVLSMSGHAFPEQAGDAIPLLPCPKLALCLAQSLRMPRISSSLYSASLRTANSRSDAGLHAAQPCIDAAVCMH